MSLDKQPDEVRSQAAKMAAVVWPAPMALRHLTPEQAEFARMLFKSGAYGTEHLREPKQEPPQGPAPC